MVGPLMMHPQIPDPPFCGWHGHLLGSNRGVETGQVIPLVPRRSRSESGTVGHGQLGTCGACTWWQRGHSQPVLFIR